MGTTQGEFTCTQSRKYRVKAPAPPQRPRTVPGELAGARGTGQAEQGCKTWTRRGTGARPRCVSPSACCTRVSLLCSWVRLSPARRSERPLSSFGNIPSPKGPPAPCRAELNPQRLRAVWGGAEPESEPQGWAGKEGSYPKPSISVSPGGVIPVGGNVTIRCWHQRLGMRILFYKDGAGNYTAYTDPAGSEAEFPITSARREHGGSYTCRYSNRTGETAYSEPSDPVQIIVAEPSYPKPNITLQSPSWGVSLGGAVAIWCRGQRQGVRFVLNKERRHFPPVDSDRFEGVFPISNVSREDGGSYSCSYHSRSEPFNVSYPSDPVELVVRDPSLPRPSISLSPTRVTAPGADVTIRCQGQRRDVRFFLHKAGDRNPQRHMDPAEAGVEFHIPSVGRQYGGSYGCSYRPQSEPFISSQPSDPAELVVADPSLPRPNISLSPTGVTPAEADVIIRCEGQRRDVRFFLHKAGDLNPQQHMDTAGNVSEFRIPSVGRQHGGNYSCSYRPRSEPFISSQLSDPVELEVSEPSYPKPTISGIPSEGVSLGGFVTIWCKGQHQGVQFVLNKDGLHIQSVDSDSHALFLINNVRREQGGNYSCSYRSKSEPFTMSDPSDPVELVVRDPSLSRPDISLSPTGVIASGADVTIRCEGQHRDVLFFLHKAGDLNPQRHMDPAGAGAEFHIPSVGRQHGGSYSCSYRPPSEPFVSSLPSDPVQLEVAG